MSKTATNKNRILEEFLKLISFDSESFHEREISEYLKKKLTDLGLEVSEDDAREKLLANDSNRIQTASNIYGYLKGNIEGEIILFSSHLDTVSPGNGKKAIVHEDGKITSDGNTVLGADDVSGLVSILEALTVVKENNLSHPDIEVLFTVAEEPYCEGSRYIDYSRLKAKNGYVLDLTGDIGRAAIAAPSIISLEIAVKGKAAHAGFNPEEGINALSIAVNALTRIKTGHTSENTTVNFGTISGGTGKNIVPEEIFIKGEVRSLKHNEALKEIETVKEVFEAEAKKHGGEVNVNVIEHIKAYGVDESSFVVRKFVKAVLEDDRCRMPECIVTFGGSDANRLNENGIATIVMACGMENCHSKTEYTRLDDIERSAGLTLKLMTLN